MSKLLQYHLDTKVFSVVKHIIIIIFFDSKDERLLVVVWHDYDFEITVLFVTNPLIIACITFIMGGLEEDVDLFRNSLL